MSTSYPPHYAYPSAPPLLRAKPTPPRLHWGWVLLLTVLTAGIFASVWLLIQARWIRRMREGRSGSYWMAVANLAWLPLVACAGFAIGFAMAIAPSAQVNAAKTALDAASRLISIPLYLGTVFWMRSEMQDEPIDLPLSGGMTFLFGTFFFQYHLQDYGAGSSQALSFHPANDDPALLTNYPSAAEVGVVLPTASGDQRLSGTTPSAQDPA